MQLTGEEEIEKRRNLQLVHDVTHIKPSDKGEVR